MSKKISPHKKFHDFRRFDSPLKRLLLLFNILLIIALLKKKKKIIYMYFIFLILVVLDLPFVKDFWPYIMTLNYVCCVEMWQEPKLPKMLCWFHIPILPLISLSWIPVMSNQYSTLQRYSKKGRFDLISNNKSVDIQ